MRERIIVAGFKSLQRCSPEQLPRLLLPLAQLVARGPAADLFTRMLNVNYDAVGSLVVPEPQVRHS